MNPDLALAMELQAQFDLENVMEAHSEMSGFLPEQFRTPDKKRKSSFSSGIIDPPETSIIAPEWEDLDPTPDLQSLFLQFNEKFFWTRLSACEVKWSPRMTVCAGICSYQRRSGYCSIRLSVPLLKLRPRKDLVETLLHEMIHAYLFVTDGNDDHDGHGPAFHEHMYRINKETGTKISVYHNFHDEVAVYKTHWWKCNGPCQHRPPFHGMVKRSMNRAPGPNDRWFPEHQATCGGSFIKVKEPEDYGKKKPSKRKLEMEKKMEGQKDIRNFIKNDTSNSDLRKDDGKENNSGNTSCDTLWKGKANVLSSQSPTFKSSDKDPNIAVRSFWADKFSSSKKPTTSAKEPLRKEPLGKEPLGKEPLGKEPLKKEPLGKEPLGKKVLKKKTNTMTSATSSKPTLASKMADCPVCSEKVPESFINSHLDECLTMSSLKSSNPGTETAIPDVIPIEVENKNSKMKSLGKVIDLTTEDSQRCKKCKREVLKTEFEFHKRFCD